ncbi:hypothetical protein F8S13_04365 [Chloroflexia bacterium SDU3-3]|nr:hypothetical protein F8S13_04365 [Chloroflexia bacterium SDU3-3]
MVIIYDARHGNHAGGLKTRPYVIDWRGIPSPKPWGLGALVVYPFPKTQKGTKTLFRIFVPSRLRGSSIPQNLGVLEPWW